MRTTAFVFALVVSVCGSASAQEWDLYTNIGDGFKVNFPGQPRITEGTYTSQMNYTLPKRVYSAQRGRETYSITVVDYANIRQMGIERAKTCEVGNANCRANGGPALGDGYALHDARGAIVHAVYQLLKRDARLDYMAWEWQDMVEGHLVQLTNNADKSRTFAWVGMHNNKLYILEGTVPAGSPEPGLFQQSMGWVDKDGNGIRYQQIVYSNAYHGLGVYPAPSYPRPAPQSAGPAPGESLSQSYRGSQSRNVEYQKVAPFKVFDNLYYVGPGSVSVWLIPTTDGLILIDSAEEPLVDHVIDSIRKAGFDPKNIRYILLSHGHLDHFGGAAKLQALSGARVAALPEDWQLIEAAARQPGRGGAAPPLTPKRDMVLKEGDVIRLGTTELRTYHLPGHTPGSASWSFTVFDNGRPHKAFLFGGPGQRNGVEGGKQFLNSVRRIKKEFADVDVPVHVHSWLTSHPAPEGGTVFEPGLRLAKRGAGDPHPFVNNAAWRAWLDVAEANALKAIEESR